MQRLPAGKKLSNYKLTEGQRGRELLGRKTVDFGGERIFFGTVTGDSCLQPRRSGPS